MNQQNTEKKIYQKWWFWLIALFIVSALLNKKGSHSATSNGSSGSSGRYESQTLTCDYCGKSFFKSSGVQLSGHSEVFCSSACATNWAWQHNIGVNQ